MDAEDQGVAEVLTIAAWGSSSGPRARVTFGDPSDELGRSGVACDTREKVLGAVQSWLERIGWGNPSDPDDHQGTRLSGH